MNNNIIYTSFLKSVWTGDVATTVTLKEVINRIRSDEFKSLIEEIRVKTSTKQRQAVLKKQLSAFTACCVLNNDENTRVCELTELNGIIQFDIDTKDNEGIDFDELRNALLKVDGLIYLFWSSRKGLKFGIMTDLKHNVEDGSEVLKTRFKQGYDFVEKYLHSQLKEFSINYDVAARSVRLSCLLSHDKDAYLNLVCSVFKINDQCVYKEQEFRSLSSHQEVDNQRVLDMLSHVSRDLKYNDRFNVNSYIIQVFGSGARSILEGHWNKIDRKQLRTQIDDQIKTYSRRGKFEASFGILVNYAKANGWVEVSGTATNLLKAEVTTEKLSNLFTHEEATLKLKGIVQSFFQDGKSRFINFSTGAGKTQQMLQVLEEIGSDTKIIYLVKTHELAGQIREDFYKIRDERSKTRTFKQQHSSRSSMDHLRGRKDLCEIDAKYVDASKVLAWYCHKDLKRGISESETCMFQAECRYTAQFDGLGSIRVMTHNEYFNVQAKYWGGVDSNGEVRKGKWKADYLIIDEDIFTSEHYKETIKSRFTSIKKILISYAGNNDLGLEASILANVEAVFEDALLNIKDEAEEFLISKIKAKEKEKTKMAKFSELFFNISQFAKTHDRDYLKGMRVKDLSEIHQSVMNSAADRYKNISTLFLDATANETIIKRLLNDIEFHSISVKTKDDIHLYQLENKTISKSFLSTEEGINTAIFGIKKLTEKYIRAGKSVGLITYKGFNSRDEFKYIRELVWRTGFIDFDEFLADAVGIEKFGHFGNLRGLNGFEDLDCLIIAGRHRLDDDGTENLTWAIFNEAGSKKTIRANSLVRMKDGSVSKLNSYVILNDKTRAVSEHTALAETLQAIGRGRLIHGKAKDIYFLSNENLGQDIEVSDFIRFENIFLEDLIATDCLESLSVRGFIVNSKAELHRETGLTLDKIERNMNRIEKELNGAGFSKVEVLYKDLNRKNVRKEFWMKDEALMMKDLSSKMKTFISCNAIN